MEKTKYIILCANCAHPSGELKYFLAEDDDGNTIEFGTKGAAKKYCAQNYNGVLAYVILCTSDFIYE